MNNVSLKERTGIEKLATYLTVFFGGVVFCLAIVWMTGVIPGLNSPDAGNSIMTITPYRHNGQWVFDDVRAGLIREPFVTGIPEMIDAVTGDIPDAGKGFNLVFSAVPFPGYEHKMTWLRAESGGHHYRLDQPDLEGWLCPAMFQYFSAAPATLYVSAEPKTE